jgi:hypothetical protein
MKSQNYKSNVSILLARKKQFPASRLHVMARRWKVSSQNQRAQNMPLYLIPLHTSRKIVIKSTILEKSHVAVFTQLFRLVCNGVPLSGPFLFKNFTGSKQRSLKNSRGIAMGERT